MSSRVFPDHRAAGHRLGGRVATVLARRPDLAPTRPVVIGLARGGVPVAREVADAIGGDLETLVVRKIGAPGHEEFAMGAVTADHLVVNDDCPTDSGCRGSSSTRSSPVNAGRCRNGSRCTAADVRASTSPGGR